MGLTPIIGNELNKTTLNVSREVLLVSRELLHIKHIELKIGSKKKSYESIVFSNVDKMSKFLKISQPSSITDGKFEVTIFKHRSKIKLLLTLLRASVSGVREDAQVSKFRIQTISKTLAQTDGEIIAFDANSKVTISIEKQALHCMV